MDGRSATDTDGAERFVFFVRHLSCFFFCAVSAPLESHKTIYSDNTAADVTRCGCGVAGFAAVV